MVKMKVSPEHLCQQQRLLYVLSSMKLAWLALRCPESPLPVPKHVCLNHGSILVAHPHHGCMQVFSNKNFSLIITSSAIIYQMSLFKKPSCLKIPPILMGIKYEVFLTITNRYKAFSFPKPEHIYKLFFSFNYNWIFMDTHGKWAHSVTLSFPGISELVIEKKLKINPLQFVKFLRTVL